MFKAVHLRIPIAAQPGPGTFETARHGIRESVICSLMATMRAALVIVALTTGTMAQGPLEPLGSDPEILNAFREVVQAPRHAIVRILEESKPRAFGAIIASDGRIVTKASEIQDATHCQLSNGEMHEFRVITQDERHDLALLKIDAGELTVIDWTLSEPKLGQWMITCGTGELPVAVGVLSAARHPVPRIRGVLGVEVVDPSGVARVRRVFRESAASEAGIERGDVILQVDEVRVATGRKLIETIGKHRPGETIVLQVERDEEMLEFTVTLTHPFGAFLSRIAEQNQFGGELSFRRDDFEAVLQHDTVLMPKECGGPVLNLKGEAVGINIARAGRTESFILPADVVVEFLEEAASEQRSQAAEAPNNRPQSPALPEPVPPPVH